MSESTADDGLDWDGFVGQIVAANPDAKPEWDRPPKSLAEQLHASNPDLFPARHAPMEKEPSNCGHCPYESMQRERDDARGELRRLRESLELIVGRWEVCGGAHRDVWQRAAEAVRNALSPKPETVGALLTQLVQAAEDGDKPISREFLSETVGKLAKLLSTP